MIKKESDKLLANLKELERAQKEREELAKFAEPLGADFIADLMMKADNLEINVNNIDACKDKLKVMISELKQGDKDGKRK